MTGLLSSVLNLRLTRDIPRLKLAPDLSLYLFKIGSERFRNERKEMNKEQIINGLNRRYNYYIYLIYMQIKVRRKSNILYLSF